MQRPGGMPDHPSQGPPPFLNSRWDEGGEDHSSQHRSGRIGSANASNWAGNNRWDNRTECSTLSTNNRWNEPSAENWTTPLPRNDRLEL